jgi:hypothetical protein
MFSFSFNYLFFSFMLTLFLEVRITMSLIPLVFTAITYWYR